MWIEESSWEQEYFHTNMTLFNELNHCLFLKIHFMPWSKFIGLPFITYILNLPLVLMTYEHNITKAFIQLEHHNNALPHTIKKTLQTLILKQDHVLWQAGLLTCQAAVCTADLLLTDGYTKFYLTYFCQWWHHMHSKLLGFINVDFNVTHQLLTIYTAFIIYLSKN